MIEKVLHGVILDSVNDNRAFKIKDTTWNNHCTMKKTETCNTSELSIHLQSVRSFLPGQTLTGYVSRSSPCVSAETTISITFWGKCNTEFFHNHSSLCRSSLDLFGQDGVRVGLFRGPLHIQSSGLDEKKWPFAIKIPTHPDPISLRPHLFGNASYLPLMYADQHALPPSFDLAMGSTGLDRRSATIEYYLEAIMMATSSSKPVIARIPVQLGCESSPFPITDFDIILNSRQLYTVTSPSLVPGMERTRTSTGRKIASVFGLSKAPHLAFRLEMTMPSVLQKNNPYQIPFLMRAIPEWEDTSECISAVPQVIDINEVTLTLRSTSSLMGFAQVAPGATALVHESHSVTKIILGAYVKSKDTRRTQKNPHAGTYSGACALGGYSPASSNPLSLSVCDDSKPLDLGQMLDIKLQNRQLHVEEVPTFVTYNIKRTYDLEWRISLEVAGVILKVKGKHPVLVMQTADKDLER